MHHISDMTNTQTASLNQHPHNNGNKNKTMTLETPIMYDTHWTDEPEENN